jgi:hypothetical protein
LGSLYVGEIAIDKTETSVDYNAIKGIDKVIFTKLDLRPEKTVDWRENNRKFYLVFVI